MLNVDKNRKTFVVYKNITHLTSKSLDSVDTETIESLSFSELRELYRKIYLPIKLWDGSEKTIDLFDSIALSMKAYKDSDSLTTILSTIKLDTVTYLLPEGDIATSFGRWHTSPEQHFSVSGVKPGTHPTQPIRSEDATDLILIPREDNTIDDAKVIWCIDKYFHHSVKMESGVHYIPGGTDSHRSLNSELALSCLDVSDFDLGESVLLSTNGTVVDNDLIIKYPDGIWDGALLFIAGKLMLTIRDNKSTTKTHDRLRLNINDLNLSLTHLGEWSEVFDVTIDSLETLLNHKTSFFVPYRGCIYGEYTNIKNIGYDADNVSIGPIDYNGEILVDEDNEVAPFLLKKYPIVDANQQLLITYTPNCRNIHTAANHHNTNVEAGIISTMANLGISVFKNKKSNHYSLLRIVSQNGFKFGESDG